MGEATYQDSIVACADCSVGFFVRCFILLPYMGEKMQQFLGISSVVLYCVVQ